jgi:putative zinc finger/helix-turn-helix YgiT family protein
MKPYPWKCATCRERAVHPATILYTAELQHDGRPYTVQVPDLQVHRCDRCGALTLDDSANRRVSDALRREAGLLLPAEIRRQREALGLTQKQLASALHLAESTLSRWETGAQIQQRAMDLLLRLFFEIPEARRFLRESEPPPSERAEELAKA